MAKGIPWLTAGLYMLSVVLVLVFFVQGNTHSMTLWGIMALMNQATVNHALRGTEE